MPMRKIYRVMRKVGKQFREDIGKRSNSKEAVLSIKQLRDKLPDQSIRMGYFEKTIGKKMWQPPLSRKLEPSSLQLKIKNHYLKTGQVDLPKEIRNAPLAIAIERSLDTLARKKKYSRVGKRLKRRGLVKKISAACQKGQLSFEDGAKIDLPDKVKLDLFRNLEVDTGEFMALFRQHFKEETGWARYYILTIIDPTEVLNAWERQFSEEEKKRRLKNNQNK